MDSAGFDALTRSLARSTTRRGFFGTALAIAAAALGSHTGRAQNGCPPGQTPNRKGDCSCPPGTDACPDGCFDRSRDLANCGGCGRVCAGGECRKGECRCPGGTTLCNGVCVDRSSDLLNCGGCGVVCPATPDACQGAAICQAGACGYVPLAAQTPCDDGSGCTQGSACDGNGQCVGSQPVVCTPLDVCHDAGVCDPATGQCSNPAKANGTPCGVEGQTCCGGSCCAVGEECVGGVCQGDCAAVGGVCADESECCQNGGVAGCEAGICCLAVEEACAADGECCSGRCNGEFCCVRPTGSCDNDGQCCSGGLGVCDQGICACATIGLACRGDSECCAGLACSGGTCQPTECLELAEVCLNSSQCCNPSAFCAEGRIGTGLICCRGPRGFCSSDAQCCGFSSFCLGSQCCIGQDGSCDGLAGDPGCCAGLTCVGGANGTYQLVCPAGSRTCGVGCCPVGQECCNGVCCTSSQDCRNNICQECLGLRAACDPANNICCQDEPTVCLESGGFFFDRECCRPLGGACRPENDAVNSDCCSGSGRHCGFEGICGGEGAECRSDDMCVSGECLGRCTNQFPVRACVHSDDCDCDGDLEDGCVAPAGICAQKECQ